MQEGWRRLVAPGPPGPAPRHCIPPGLAHLPGPAPQPEWQLQLQLFCAAYLGVHTSGVLLTEADRLGEGAALLLALLVLSVWMNAAPER